MTNQIFFQNLIIILFIVILILILSFYSISTSGYLINKKLIKTDIKKDDNLSILV